MIIARFILPTIVALSLTHCLTSFDFSKRVYQQGNALPTSKVERLKIGMSKQDVIQLLGSTLVDHAFNTDHLDYAYTWRQNGTPSERRYLCLTFKNDRLRHIDYNATHS